MKIKNGFMLREIAGQWVVVPIGTRVVEFNGIMTLSESGALLWKMLQKNTTEEEMANAILSEYDISKEIASADIKEFIQMVTEKNLLETA